MIHPRIAPHLGLRDEVSESTTDVLVWLVGCFFPPQNKKQYCYICIFGFEHFEEQTKGLHAVLTTRKAHAGCTHWVLYHCKQTNKKYRCKGS